LTPQINILLHSHQSNDAVGIVELTVPPEWDGPRLHNHDFDEPFYVLDGELTFQLGGDLPPDPGSSCSPRGAIHTLANLNEATGTLPDNLHRVSSLSASQHEPWGVRADPRGVVAVLEATPAMS
jgi:hypothetical protein